jgi:Protein of unknown function (DUF2794)
MSQLIRLAERRPAARHLFFTRAELNLLLSLYSRRVAAGEWRDYAIDHRPGIALFSVFKHSYARPAFAIAKYLNRDRSIDYRALSEGRRIKQSKDLADVLRVIERQLRVVSGM